MTGTSPDSNGNGAEPAVDRRWFEEALRAQGFVVEPPMTEGPAPTAPVAPAPTTSPPAAPQPAPSTSRRWPDHGPEPVRLAAPVTPVASDPTPRQSSGPQPPATLPDDRPPTPSGAIAERIAGTGRGGPSPTEAAATAIAVRTDAPAPAVVPPMTRPDPGSRAWPESDTRGSQPPEAVPPVLQDTSAPWSAAVPASVAPWAAGPSPVELTSAEPTPAAPAADEPGIEPTAPLSDEAVADSSGAPLAERPPVAQAALDVPEPTVALKAAVTQGPLLDQAPDTDETDPATSEPPPPALTSPYAPVGGPATPEAGPRPEMAHPTEPETSEGELWALVGASVGPSAQRAPTSQVTTFILTVLVALVALVVVIGSMVVLSQLL